MKETVTINLQTFKEMDDICRNRDTKLDEALQEVGRLVKAKNVVTINSYSNNTEYWHTDEVKIKEILGSCFSKLESDKKQLGKQVEDLKDKVGKLIKSRESLEKKIEDIECNVVFKFLGFKLTK